MKYRRFPPFFIVKNGIHGLGVFLTQDVKKGALLFIMKGDMLDHPTRTSVQVGKHRHIEDVLASYINHSCKPTAKVARRQHAFVSLRDLEKGDEITFDYNKNEDKMASPFVCECCGRKIKGRY